MKKLTKAITKLVAGVSATAMMAMTSVSAVEIKTFSEDLSVYLNGENVYLQSSGNPIICNDRTMVPLRPIFEAMGWECDYMETADNGKQVYIRAKNDASAGFYRFVDGWDYFEYGFENEPNRGSLDVPAMIYNDVFYVPIRAFCEAVGYGIDWNNTARRVDVKGSITGNHIDVDNHEDSEDSASNTETALNACPKCGSENLTIAGPWPNQHFLCLDCGNRWGSTRVGTDEDLHLDEGAPSQYGANYHITEETAIALIKQKYGVSVTLESTATTAFTFSGEGRHFRVERWYMSDDINQVSIEELSN